MILRFVARMKKGRDAALFHAQTECTHSNNSLVSRRGGKLWWRNPPRRTCMPLTIRPLQQADEKEWRQAFAAFWTFFGRELDSDLYDLTWQRLFDPAERMYAIGAFDHDHLIGLAHIVAHRSFSAEGLDHYMQHLFVEQHARKKGIGRALIQWIYASVEAEGGHRVYWNTPADNEPALKLYDSIARDVGFRLYRKEFLRAR